MKLRFFNTYQPVASYYENLAPYLSRLGADVELVISKAEYREGRNLHQILAKFPNVRWVQMPNLGLRIQRGAWEKLIIAALYMISASLYALFGPHADKNVFLSQPPLIPVLGLVLSKIRRQAYCCVIMDIQPDLAVKLGIVRKEAFSTKLHSELFTLSLRHASASIVIGCCMAHHVAQMGIAAERIHTIRNWADETDVVPVAHRNNQLRRDQDWQKTFIVMYAGNIGIPQQFDDMLAAAELLRDEPHIRFVFVGGGARQSAVSSEIKRRDLQSVIMLPFLHETYSLAEIMSAADVHIVPLRRVCTGLAIPSKSYTILATGRPMIYQGGKDSEIAQMIAAEDNGSFVAEGDVIGLREGILAYYSQPELCQAHGVKARQLAEGKYSRQRSLAQYASVFGVQLQDATSA